MACGGRKSLIFYFFIFCYLLVTAIKNRHAYRTCYAPINSFLIMTYATNIFISIFAAIATIPDLSHRLAKYLVSFSYWILCPIIIYIPLQGLTWQIENMTYSSGCIPQSYSPWMIWCWIVIDFIAAFVAFVLLFHKIRNVIQIRIFQRKAHNFNTLLAQKDFEAIRVQLLGPAGPNNQGGLSSEEMRKIPSPSSSPSFFERLVSPGWENCSVCYEDFKEGDDVWKLPICEHYFHSGCVSSWLVENSSCVICQADVKANLEKYLQNQPDYVDDLPA